jgi:hypothetical protein
LQHLVPLHVVAVLEEPPPLAHEHDVPVEQPRLMHVHAPKPPGFP